MDLKSVFSRLKPSHRPRERRGAEKAKKLLVADSKDEAGPSQPRPKSETSAGSLATDASLSLAAADAQDPTGALAPSIPEELSARQQTPNLSTSQRL